MEKEKPETYLYASGSQAGVVGIEPTSGVLETLILPMNYTPMFCELFNSLTTHLLYHKTKKDASSFTSFSRVYTLKTSHSSFFKLLHSNNLWSSPRPISNSQLHALLHFHLCPIYLVVFKGSYFPKEGISHLEGGFTLRCLQRLSRPNLATLPWFW